MKGMIQSAVPGEFTHEFTIMPFDSMYKIVEDLCR